MKVIIFFAMYFAAVWFVIRFVAACTKGGGEE